MVFCRRVPFEIPLGPWALAALIMQRSSIGARTLRALEVCSAHHWCMGPQAEAQRSRWPCPATPALKVAWLSDLIRCGSTLATCNGQVSGVPLRIRRLRLS